MPPPPPPPGPLLKDISHGLQIPTAIICVLSVCCSVTTAHVLFETARSPPIPNQIVESGQLPQPISLLAIMPILALAPQLPPKTLNPSTLQLSCKDPSEPRSDFHVSRPSVVLRFCPSAISENKESAVLFMRIKCFSSC